MNSNDSVSRRSFLKAAGLGAAWLRPGASPWTTMAGPFEKGAGIEHFVPADKQLSKEWIRSLFERGGPRVCKGKELDTIGMPIGGLGAGQLYLLGDGRLGYWEVFNARDFTGYGATNWQYRVPARPVEQGFAIAVRNGPTLSARPLNRDAFPNVEFVGQYPIGRVRYPDPAFPVQIEMEAFSPFIPLNAKDSGLPATLFQITAQNSSAATVEVRLAAWLENAVCLHSEGEIVAQRRNRILPKPDRASIFHTLEESSSDRSPARREPIVLADFEGTDYGGWQSSGEAFGDRPARGTLPSQQTVSGFLGDGLVNSYLGQDGPHGTLTSPAFQVSRRYLNFLIGGGNHKGETCLNLLIDGRTVRTATGRNDERLQWASWNVQEFEGAGARLEIVDRSSSPWGHLNVDQIELSDERRSGALGPIPELPDFGSLALALAGAAATNEEAEPILRLLPISGHAISAAHDVAYPTPQRRSSGIVSRAIPLKPGEKHTFVCALGWFFPNRPGRGQAYANWFADAMAVTDYVLNDRQRLAGQTRLWQQTYYDSTLPHWLLDRIGATVCNLATGTCQWWKNGRFWGWEGVGCCEGTCTHVWNYEHALARLFPELERSIRQMQDFGEGFDSNSGLVGFRGNRAYAADGQCGTILKAYREHLTSKDTAFLERNWPRIKKALEFAIQQDGNDDGLIENSQHNTYDINFEGPNTFVGSLYLAALRAGEEMAKTRGDPEFAGRLRQIFERGRRQSSQRLWNGEYFVQRVDLEKHPKHQYGDGCLSDHLFGQGWAHQVGLGYLYPKEQVRQALASIWKYNWAPDVTPQNTRHKPERWFVTPGQAGLFTCTWPHSPHLSEGVRYRDEVWTGIEYQVAGHMIWEGMLEEGLAMMRAIHDRYDPAEHNPYNEIECGDHYARALASWGAFLALAGFESDAPNGHLGFAPRITPDSFRTAFTASHGWGTFAQVRRDPVQTARITVRWGELDLKSLAFELPQEPGSLQVRVRLDDRAIAVDHRQEGRRTRITFRQTQTVKSGQTLEIQIHSGSPIPNHR